MALEPLKTPRFNTDQEVFDHVWDWFVVKGRPLGHDEEGDCRYYLADHHRCVMGSCLDGEHPAFLEREEMLCFNDTNIGAFLEDSPWAASHFGRDVDYGFLVDLQMAHDSCVGTETPLENKLRQLAKHCNLTVPSGRSNNT